MARAYTKKNLSKVKLDLSGLKLLKKRLETATDHEVRVGHFNGKIPHNKKNTQQLTVAQISVIQQYGSVTRKIPARPYMKRTAKSRKSRFRQEMIKTGRDIFLGKGTFARHAKEIGKRAVKDMQRTILQWPRGASNASFGRSNAPSTIAKKGKDSPLRDDLHLTTSIQYKSVRRSPVKKRKKKS